MHATDLIDVSHHQGVIDWETVKASGIDGAIIRCGYGINVKKQDDAQWKRNADECTRLGIPFGAYLYSYADTKEKAESEADHAIRLLSGYRLSYPVYYDLEEKGTEEGAEVRARVFCEKIRAAGYVPGVYANKDWWDHYLKNLTEYSRWAARYHNVLEMEGVDIWQYTSAGTVAGIRGDVDRNYCYRDFPAELWGNGKEILAVDGRWGPAVTRRLQQIFGTTVDGKVSNQHIGYKMQNPGLSSSCWEWKQNPVRGSQLIAAMQNWLNENRGAGLEANGWIGPLTIKAIQAWMGTVQDGYFSRTSICIRKLQEWANRQP